MSPVVELFRNTLNAKTAHLFIFDDERGELFIRASSHRHSSTVATKNMPFANSACAKTRHEARTVYVKDLSVSPFDTSAEHRVLGGNSFVGSVVAGPDGQPVGVLAALDPEIRFWTLQDAARADEIAYLISQQIMLRAALETLRIISRERRIF